MPLLRKADRFWRIEFKKESRAFYTHSFTSDTLGRYRVHEFRSPASAQVAYQRALDDQLGQGFILVPDDTAQPGRPRRVREPDEGGDYLRELLVGCRGGQPTPLTAKDYKMIEGGLALEGFTVLPSDLNIQEALAAFEDFGRTKFSMRSTYGAELYIAGAEVDEDGELGQVFGMNRWFDLTRTAKRLPVLILCLARWFGPEPVRLYVAAHFPDGVEPAEALEFQVCRGEYDLEHFLRVVRSMPGVDVMLRGKPLGCDVYPEE